MFNWVNQHIEKATVDMEEMISESTGIPQHEKPQDQEETAPLYQPFQLPIQYLEESDCHTLSPIVSNDLELYQPNEDNSVYDIMFQPSSPFAKDVFQEWSKQYTTNTVFLEETQQIIKETPLDDYP